MVGVDDCAFEHARQRVQFASIPAEVQASIVGFEEDEGKLVGSFHLSQRRASFGGVGELAALPGRWLERQASDCMVHGRLSVASGVTRR